MADGRRASGRRPTAVIGRDPRVSGEFLSAAVAAGLASSGVDVFDAGVVPTPGMAFLVGDMRADFGVMISASHNPAPDNGIKIFAAGGVKLPDEVEDRIEVALRSPKLSPTGADVGRIRRFSDAEDRYLVHLLSTLPHRLDGIHVVLDCAHGAAAGISPQVFTDAGARVTVIGADPDGLNINDGVGSTHLDNLATAVVHHRADLGIAHDGDADRCLAVDHLGRVVDGDQIMAILALSMAERGVLAKRTLVATVMSNLGPQTSHGRARHPGARDEGRRPLRARGALGRRVLARRGAVRSRHHDQVRDHRRRDPHRPAPRGRDGSHPVLAGQLAAS